MSALLTSAHPKFIPFGLRGEEMTVTASEIDLAQLFHHLGTVFRNRVIKLLLFLKILG